MGTLNQRTTGGQLLEECLIPLALAGVTILKTHSALCNTERKGQILQIIMLAALPPLKKGLFQAYLTFFSLWQVLMEFSSPS
jgi:hypothetical protein